MCVGELPSVNDTLFSWPKRSHLIIEPPLFRAGFAIPVCAPLSGDHCSLKMRNSFQCGLNMQRKPFDQF